MVVVCVCYEQAIPVSTVGDFVGVCFVDVCRNNSIHVCYDLCWGRGSTVAADLSPLIIRDARGEPHSSRFRQASQGGCIPEICHSRMSDENIAAATLATRSAHEGPSTPAFYVAIVCLIWYVAVTLVSTLGYVQV
jgi:hypothetical protein